MSQVFLPDNQRKNIKTRYNSNEYRSSCESVPSKSKTYSKSDVDIIQTIDFPSIIDIGSVMRSEEYYRKYEHDDVPVKDDNSCSDKLISDMAATAYETEKELTNSELDKLEYRIFRNISKELQTDESFREDNLEPNIKLFKTTVQGIFDNFNSNLRDFEHYKKKFQDILSKTNENTLMEMEDFIKEMIIASSESCRMNDSNDTNVLTNSEMTTEDTVPDIDSATFSQYTANDDDQIKPPKTTVETYKNENYFTDSTVDKESSRTTGREIKEKTYNIYLVTGDPCVKIKMDGRNLLSEINIRNSRVEEAEQIASAENIKSVAAKKLQLKKYMSRKVECHSNDEIIPVKISYAKKNIHSQECLDNTEENKWFIFKICNYLCKKFRKNSSY